MQINPIVGRVLEHMAESMGLSKETLMTGGEEDSTLFKSVMKE